MSSANCPGCQAALKKMPSRKTKCPSCGEFMYMKRAPGETEKRLVTQAEADRIEGLWTARYEKQTFLSNSFYHGVTESEYDARLNTLSVIKQGDNIYWEVAWSLIMDRVAFEPDPFKLKMMYGYLTILAERDGMDFRPYLEASKHYSLLEITQRAKKSSIQAVKIVASEDACEICKQHDGMRYSFESAMKLAPLPCKGCQCRGIGLCSCYYQPDIDHLRN